MTPSGESVTVGVELSVEVDADAWRDLYGGETIKDVRESLREYARLALRDSGAAEDGAILGVERRAGR
jgi:hypothetical protein